jgi:L-asparagine transporter-like permease
MGGAAGAVLLPGGPGADVSLTRPGFLLEYIVVSALSYVIARYLSGIAAANSGRDSYTEHIRASFGRAAAVTSIWCGWMGLVTASMAELTAVGALSHLWVPKIPQWLPALTVLLALHVTNGLIARAGGADQFWLVCGRVIFRAALRALADFILPRGLQRLFQTAGSVTSRMLVAYLGCTTVTSIAFSRGTNAGPLVVALRSPGMTLLEITMSLLLIYALIASSISMLSEAARIVASSTFGGSEAAESREINQSGVQRRVVTAAIVASLATLLLNYFASPQALKLLLSVSTAVIPARWLLFALGRLRFSP